MVQKGVYFFDNKPFIVKPWNENMDLNTEELVSLPIWVRFPDHDVKYWGSDSLSKLGSMLGIPIKTDKFTRDKAFLRYARLLIEMKLQDNCPAYIDFVNENNVVVRQQVEYEWKPSKCTFCKMFGHTNEECRKKPLPRAEWRPIRQNPLSSSPTPAQPSMDAEGFIQVRRKTTVTAYKEQATPTQLENRFENLTEGENPENVISTTEDEGLPQWREYVAGT